jgi:DNA replication and repair protein RecF
MYLKQLSLLNYRNFEELDLIFSEKINCFIGNNGVGKTNILDAIYYLSFCKSWLNPIDSQNINYDSDFFMIKGNYQFDELTEDINCGFKKGKKKSFKRNQKEYSKLSDHIGLIPLVTVSPYDSSLILSGSEERRKFMDITISQFDKDYLVKLLNYNKVLAQRNQLLKQFAQSNYFDKDSLEVWDMQLVKLGNSIFEKRLAFVTNIIPVFQKYYNTISEEREIVDLQYKSQLADGEFTNQLEENIAKDRALQYTNTGIHKDDLIFNLREHPLKKNASQGQQKTYIIALKLAQFDYIKKISNHKPILLFDDIFDKLDALRVRQIIHLAADFNFGQIFITDTNKDRLDGILKEIHIPYKLFNINDKIEELTEDFN